MRGELALQVKRLSSNTGYGGDWTLRIKAAGEKAAPSEAGAVPQSSTRQISLIFYVADEHVRLPSSRVILLYSVVLLGLQTCSANLSRG